MRTLLSIALSILLAIVWSITLLLFLTSCSTARPAPTHIPALQPATPGVPLSADVPWWFSPAALCMGGTDLVWTTDRRWECL
jgi:hypothetical protein